MGGQLGSTLLACYLLLVLYSSTAKNIPPEDLRFLGGPRRRGDAGGAPTREFGPILPSDEADMCLFFGLKLLSEENLVKYRARKSQKRKTNCGCELRNSNLSRKSLTTKNAKRKTDCGFELRATRI